MKLTIVKLIKAQKTEAGKKGSEFIFWVIFSAMDLMILQNMEEMWRTAQQRMEWGK